MQTDSYNNIFVEILISSRLRVVRHLLLFVCVLLISTGNIWHVIDQGIILTSFQKYGGLLFSTCIAVGGCYLNIYVLIPKLFLKNKWGWYFFSLLGVALLLLIVFLTISVLAGASKIEPDSGDLYYFHLLKGIINILSSTLSFFLLVAGTSTMVLFKNWILDMKQSKELESATLQLELKLLENQINPHFLFNMLNNANIMIRKDPDVALHIIDKLEEMLRYQMSDNIREKVCLREEILFLNDFLEMEKTRRDYFNYTISKEGTLDNIQIAPLLFMTFVENAVKHNQDSKTTSYVHILFKITNDRLIFICENSIPQRPSHKKEVGGIGLANIKRRLDLLYEEDYSLEQSKTDTNYTVKLELKL